MRLRAWLALTGIVLLTNGCGGHSAHPARGPVSSTTSTAQRAPSDRPVAHHRVKLATGPPTVPTKVCGQTVVIVGHVIMPVSLRTNGPPRRLTGHAYSAHLFRWATGCTRGLPAQARPRRCALPGHPAMASDGLPVARLYLERCSYNVRLAGHLAAVVTVHR